jgi:UDP-3-O-[3-hydroxymyristoyl] glucosamine N-acyltransferase
LAELAARLGGHLGATLDPAAVVEAVALPRNATSRELSFIEAGATQRVCASDAVAMLCADVADVARPLLVSDVQRALARAAEWLPINRRSAWRERRTPDVASSAEIAPSAILGSGVQVGEGARVAAGAVLGAGVSIGAFCTIGAGCVVTNHAKLGNRVRLDAHCVIGSDGFAYLRDGTSWLSVPAFGSVVIGDDVNIHAHAVVHAGIFGDTVIASGCMLDSHVLIGHDARIGAGTAIAGHTAVAGAAEIGRRCRIGGAVGIGEGVNIADDVTVTAMSMVMRSLPRAGGSYSSGWPAQSSIAWWRRIARSLNDARGAPVRS